MERFVGRPNGSAWWRSRRDESNNALVALVARVIDVVSCRPRAALRMAASDVSLWTTSVDAVGRPYDTGCRACPRKLATSHVENGAVNGDRIKSISDPANNLANMSGVSCRQSKRNARPHSKPYARSLRKKASRR